MPPRKTDYKQLWRRAQRENLKLQTTNFGLIKRIESASRLLVILRDIIDKYIPDDRKEDFKKELDQEVKAKELDNK